MASQVEIVNPSPSVHAVNEAEPAAATTLVRSRDGTTIGYRTLGTGPGVVLVHGAMESAESHRQLAEALAASCTAHLLDRRGRGLSGPVAPAHTIDRDVEDVQAVIEATGSRFLFGVSSGGVIVLQAALSLPSVTKVAVYEPALVDDPTSVGARIARYEREIAEGNVAAALVTAMKVTEMGPRVFKLLPSSLLARMTRLMLDRQDGAAAPDAVTMRKLAPTLHADFTDVVDASRRVEDFRTIAGRVLLLGGSKSPAYLRRALDVLERTIPDARRVEFAGLGHGGSGNSDWGGKPTVVARELERFFESSM